MRGAPNLMPSITSEVKDSVKDDGQVIKALVHPICRP